MYLAGSPRAAAQGIVKISTPRNRLDALAMLLNNHDPYRCASKVDLP
jgi:hypothetical protein